MKVVNKISIIGGSGTGKTTLSNNLGKKYHLPVYHLDAFHYSRDWEVRDKEERDKDIIKTMNQEKWIIDGNYFFTLKERLEKSDVIIFLDYSFSTRIKGAVGRYLKNIGKEKMEIPGCKERLSKELLRSVMKWKRHKRKQIHEIINTIENDNVKVFKSRKQLNSWYYQEFHEKIER